MNKRLLSTISRSKWFSSLIVVLLAATLGYASASLGLYFFPVHTPQAGSSPTPVPTASATPLPFSAHFETGVAFPRFGTTAYGPADTEWEPGLQKLQRETDAQWVELTIYICQATLASTTLYTDSCTPSPDAIAAGILKARQLGLHVFVVPHVLIAGQADPWGGDIYFADSSQAQAWFTSFWEVYKPYVVAAAQAGADQLSLGNELTGLESAPASLWNQLIANAHAVFPGKLTYDLDYLSLVNAPQPWMHNPQLSYLGVSEYDQIASQPETLTVSQIVTIWQTRLLPKLDAFSEQAGKQLLLSEIGYRNSTDALYQPWNYFTDAPPDPSLQAAAYEAAIGTSAGDSRIAGTFFWAWENGVFAPNEQSAASVLKAAYGGMETS